MRSKWFGILGVLCFSMSWSLMAQTNFRGKVLDVTTKNPIAEAQISISDQGIGVRSNDIGYFVYSKYHKVIDRNSILKIKAPGYKELVKTGADIRQLFGSVSSIYLEKEKRTKKTNPSFDDITLYWDVSASIGTYDFNNVWQGITNFLQENEVKNIQLVVFNTAIIAQENSAVNNETVSALREKLGNTKPQGLSNYELIKEANTDAIILVSNGNPIYGEPKLTGETPVYVLPIGATQNTTYLNELTRFTNGAMISSEHISGVNDQNTTTIKGVVSTVSGPIQGASILRKGSLKEYFSKADGSFVIPAEEGDILTFSFLGMQPKSLLIEDTTKPLSLYLDPIAELLDEVILEEKRKLEEEKVFTGYGEESKEKLGWATSYITSADIKPSAQFVSDILRGRFAGVTINGFGPNATISIRGGGQTFGGTGTAGPLWVIDNNLVTGATLNDINAFVDPQNIESITVIKSAAAASARYGTIGIDGAIIIRTKTGSARISDGGPSVQSLLVRGNNYKENVPLLNLSNQKASYIKELEQLSSTEERYLRYKQMEETREPSLEFYIDMAQYFQPYNQRITDEILNKLVITGSTNVKVLRVVAYLYEARGAVDKARLLYERIVKIAPREAQSYRDLAMIYQEVGEYNKALELYINMLGGQLMGVNFTGLEKPLSSELSRLVARHKDKIEFNRLPNEWLRVGYNVDLRMVIEWSDRKAPFEFQFVNPNKKYFKWIHTLDQNKRRLYEEQDQGFQMEEFIIDDAPRGDWIVNIQYLGEQDEFTLPPYLKYTVYHNYGTPQERKEIKVIKLYLQDEKVTLGRISS